MAGQLLSAKNRFHHMIPISDETLMAFADGELPPDERRAVREALSKDPLLIERLECFLLTNARLARPFRDVLNSAVPERLLRLFRAN